MTTHADQEFAGRKDDKRRPAGCESGIDRSLNRDGVIRNAVADGAEMRDEVRLATSRRRERGCRSWLRLQHLPLGEHKLRLAQRAVQV